MSTNRINFKVHRWPLEDRLPQLDVYRVVDGISNMVSSRVTGKRSESVALLVKVVPRESNFLQLATDPASLFDAAFLDSGYRVHSLSAAKAAAHRALDMMAQLARTYTEGILLTERFSRPGESNPAYAMAIETKDDGLLVVGLAGLSLHWQPFAVAYVRAFFQERL